jgi:hypothetical protein
VVSWDTKRKLVIGTSFGLGWMFRAENSASVGLGFEIPASTPSIVPNVPKLAVEEVEEVAVSC